LLVVMIIGIGASLIVPGLSATRVSAKDEATRIAALMDHAQTLAGLRGVPLAWQADARGYGFLDWRGTWKPMRLDNTLRQRDLPPGVTLELAPSLNAGTDRAATAQAASAAPLLVFPPSGFMRPFSLKVTSVEGAWNVVGDVAGRISLVEVAAP